MRGKIVVLSVCCIISVMLFVFPVEGAKFGGTPSGLDLVIERVNVDLNTDTIFIYGKNFDNGSPLVVSLGGIPLTSVLVSANEIQAGLPSSISDGDYLLKVMTGNSTNQYDVYNLTIGAVGQQGEQGLKGDKGDQGIQGLQGLEGPMGPEGLQGPQGLQGLKGDKGDTGPQGLQGLKGDKGDPGSAADLTNYYTKTQVDALLAAAVPRFVSIDAGNDETCGLTNTGNVDCWGNDTGVDAVPNVDAYKSVSTADSFACAVTVAGNMVCWGGNYPRYCSGSCQPGEWQPLDSQGNPFTYTEVSVGGGSGVRVICGLRPPDPGNPPEYICWWNDIHEDITHVITGHGTQISANVSVGLQPYVCALESTHGGISCHGANVPPTPNRIGVTQISTGPDGVCVMYQGENGPQVDCDGGEAAIVPDNVNASHPVQVSRGVNHACAVLGNGQISCWGLYDDSSHVSSPASGNFTKVAAGYIHDCGILSSGRVSCWGKDGYGGASAALLAAPRP